MADNTIDILLNARMNVSDAVGGVSEIQKAMRGLTLPKGISADLEKSFSKLTPLLKDYQKQLNKGFSSQKDIKNFNLLKEKIDSVFGDIKSQIKEVNGQEIRLKANTQEIDAVKNKIVKAQADLNNALQNVFKKNQSAASIETAFGKLENAIPKNWTKVTGMMSKASGSFKAGNYAEFNRQLQNTLNYIEKLSSTSQVDLAHKLGMDKAKTDVTDAQKYFNNFFNSLKTNIKEANNIESLRTKLSELGVELEGLNIKSLEDGPKAFEEWVQSIMNVDGALDQLHNSTQDTAKGMVRMVDEVNELKSSTQYFFSLRNMINLLKRGIDEAVQSVKDLDKAMTETAVVTDYKVSDLWGMLPEYTKIANQLGATTQGAYETMTLYYQQGLEQQQAFELGAETMKMARIAGLDYAETTDMMTAALRGFNMELNETSAKRVNDVYSELAAITASDTEELGTAMQRTASIAASAGASFEGTTAFLAQAIETTREPAENIGTAMKTIVARFQEMKKNPLEISEVDGEEVDYNKIDAALKTIGVDLKDTNGQFREFDQVMLDISAKWDTLSQSQQRYIATTAAGSRQQSRFIAMVSNYDRTMQLMEAANNSAGASDEQFGKTMDSLESKLNQLHNAWQQFTMGIANNGMIKLAVDGLTGFLNITNKIIDTLSLGSGVFKSFLSVFAAFTGLKIAGRAANSLIGGLGGLIDPTSTFKQGFKTGAIRQPDNQAKAISDPIVQAINRIYGVITGKSATQNAQNTTADFKAFKKANSDIREFLGGIADNKSFSITEAYGKISNLDTRQQKAILQQLPGLQLSLKESGISFDTAGLKGETAKLVNSFKDEINQGLKENTIDAQAAMQIFGTPENLKRAMSARGPEYAKAASEIFFNQEEYDKTYKETFQNLLTSDDAAYLSDEQMHKAAHDAATVAAEAKATEEYQKRITGKASAGMRVANDFAEIGQAAMMAGQGVAQFGMQLSNIGFTEAGQAITNLGYQISSLGSIAASVGTLVGKILDKGGIFGKTGLMAAHPAITALIVAVTALGAVFAAASAKVKKIKEAGEEVTKTFNETNKSVEDNIAKLKSYQSEFATLSKGVDSNGNNVSLDDSQYQRYLEIVDDIATINPEIVEGYNAQGHAIINNNKALAETLKKQQEIRKEAYSTYTSEDSLKALIRARNVNKDYYESITNKTKAKGTFVGGTAGQVATGYTSPMTGDVASIADKLGLIKDFDETVLEKYGIDSLEALESGEEKAVKNFIKHRQQIEAELSSSDLKLDDAVLKGFDKLGEDTAAFDEAIKPVYDNLLANVSNSAVFDSIAPEFREALNMGLKDLASQDLNAPEMAKAANNMAMRFANLTNGSGKYKDALEIVEQAQNNFASSLDETQYRADVQPAIDDLIRLKEEALNEGSAYGDALAEYLENQIQRISNFTTEGGANLTEALNTATDEIAAAEGALDSFNEATKKDFSTAAEGMKGIFDKTTETFKDSYGTEIQKHAEGMGDATFWTGAEALLSGKEIERLTKGKNGYDAAEAVAKKIKGLEPMLREGQEGFDAFTDRVLENADAMDKLAEAGVTYDKESGFITNIPDDQWHNVAEALGISDDLLTSMINKGRQFANISFMNVEEARKALAASEYTIKGTTAKSGEQQNLYVKESTLRQQLSDAGYVRKEQQDQQIQKLQKEQNIKTLKAADEYKKGSKELTEAFKDMGVKTLPDLIETLNATGDFNKDEIQAYAEKAGLMGSQDRYDSLYDSIIEAANNPELAKQTDLLSQINAQVAALRDNRTGTEAKSDYDKFHNELYGGKGHDTAAQKFGDGLNKNGKQLTAGEYEQTKKDLEESAQAAREQAAIARERAKTERGLEKERWENIAKYYDQDADYIDKLLDRGAKAFEKNQEEIDKELAAKESKDKGKKKENDKQQDIQKAAEKAAQQWYEKNGLGNAGTERQKLDWGARPFMQGQNFTNAKTWGWTADDLKNTSSTYMSAGMTIGQGKNTVELTVTPMLQTENGPQVLSQNTVSQYLNQIASKATNSDGSINIDKLFELDKEGLEVEGQQINNLLMGAFTGEGARMASDALSDIEHQLEEDKIKVQEFNKAAKQLSRQENRTQQQTPKKPETPSPQAVKESRDQGRKQERTIKTIFETEGNEQLDEAQNKIDTLSIAASSPFAVYIKTQYPELADAYNEILQVQNTAEEGVQLTASADITEATNAQTTLLDIVRKQYVAKLKASESGLSTIGSRLSSIVERIRTINSMTVQPQSKATGQNNYFPHHSLPSFGSAARGRGGTVGPKNKGGLTLTGEKGFEIAWLPSENRSMILGAGGPQMLNLPSDAVVYTHEQSKDILKRKGIPAGSHADYSGSGYQKKYTGSTTSVQTATSYVKAKKDSSAKKVTQAAAEVIKITQKAGKVLVWWENAGHRMDKTQRNAEGVQRELENLLKTFGTTAEEYKKAGEDYRKYLEQQRKIAAEEEARAKNEFKMTDKGRAGVLANQGKSKTKQEIKDQQAAKKRLDAAKAQLKKAKKTKGTGDDKKAQARVKAAQKAYNKTAGAKKDKQADRYLEAIGARREISYEVTKTTTKKGKKKTQKVTKKANVNLASYIKKDSETGAYVIDQEAINKVAKTNKSKAEAIAKAAEDQLNDLESKLKSAEDDRIKAEEELAEFYDTVYETFYAWEKTITNAYVLGQQIERLGNLRTVFDAVENLEFAKIEAGFGSVVDSLPIVSKALKQNQDLMIAQVQANRQLIDATFKEYQSALSMEEPIEAVIGSEQSEKAAKDADARREALNFLERIGQVGDFNYSEATNALNAREWTEEDYNKIKDGLDQIAEKQTAYYDAITKTYESMTEVYQTIEEYQSYMADFEKDLISGMEEQANKEIDKLSKLNSSLDTAAKDLIDEVKRKLDERRKQEDNTKTEQDIAQKQQRLAALRADTSGGHQVEIAQLEKEIADAQQGYQRTLEDQLLDRLSNQADEASKQREHQIQLLEAQRDLAAATGLNVEQINKWLQDPKQNEAQIRAAWLANNGYEDAGAQERKQLEEQFESAWLRFLAYGEVLPELANITKEDLDANGEPKQILTPVETIQNDVSKIVSLLSKGSDGAYIQNGDFTVEDLKYNKYDEKRNVSAIKGIMEANGQTVNAKDFENNDFSLEEIAQNYSAEQLKTEGYDLASIKDYKTSKELATAYSAEEFSQANIDYTKAREAFSAKELLTVEGYTEEATKELNNNYSSALKTLRAKGSKFTYDDVKAVQEAANAIGIHARTFLPAIISGKGSPTWSELLTLLKQNGWSKYRLARTFTDDVFKKAYDKVYGKGAYKKNRSYALKNKANKKKYPIYKSGGIADFTGPAWLDGTPSKPELVLNATDTKNFLILRDVLDRALSSANSVTNSYGGNATYEININVDKIEKDYDVDRVAERVKKIIVKDSGYRNVTQVRNFR